MRRLWQLSSSSSLARRQPGLPTPPRILIDRNASGWPPPLGVGGGWSSGCGRLMASGSVLAAAAKDLASYTSSSSSDQQPAGRLLEASRTAVEAALRRPLGALSAPFRRFPNIRRRHRHGTRSWPPAEHQNPTCYHHSPSQAISAPSRIARSKSLSKRHHWVLTRRQNHNAHWFFKILSLWVLPKLLRILQLVYCGDFLVQYLLFPLPFCNFPL
ncbi:hypothetical protein QR680_006075 [Steinernema hermaphroditum]|uniref:Uncharacterized protein n=1 Tax=Steinernema hermaphroditum TaxID=289476 RepID=A0AA39HWM1_9BILA|nr:hypothetical protein QR680_006075 [Steinernema hermaphroditum]